MNNSIIRENAHDLKWAKDLKSPFSHKGTGITA